MEKKVTIGSRFNGCSKRRAAANASLNISKRHASNLKRVTSLLRKKKRASRPLIKEEEEFLITNSELVKQFYKRREKRAELLKRQKELEDSPKELNEKCFKLAQAIHDAEFLIVYTGAGISTAASIPDYRGPNGIWTRLQKGKDIGHHDLTAAEPTYTHMALSYLHSKGIVRHVVSQNCDGLHLRSGLPKNSLSEVHGNMYIEVCKHCIPAREYVRTFDATEKTSTFNHTTGRRCYRCGEPLVDTIVHFGERGRLRWPLNWQGACQSAKACDTILCLGSSLKVLRKYPWLWQMNRSPKRRPHLYVVNLQWTPKDKDATIKINGKCDDVIKLVMKNLGFEVPIYVKAEDPIFQISTRLHADECVTIHRPLIKPPDSHFISPCQKVVAKNKVGVQAQCIPATLTGEELPAATEMEWASLSQSFNLSKNTSIVFSDFPRLLKENEDCKDIKVKEEDFKNFKIEDHHKFAIKSEQRNAKVEVKKEVKEEGEEQNNSSFPSVVKVEKSLNIKGECVKEEVKEEMGTLEQNIEPSGPNEELSRGASLRSSRSSLSDSEGVDSPKAEGILNRVLSLPLLSSLKNKEINFYGTGLCIRSTKQPIYQNSVDGDDDDEDDDFDDTSLSSLTSDTKSEGAHDTRKGSAVSELCDNNMDFLFVSDDSLDAVVISVEGGNFYAQDQSGTFPNFNKSSDSETFNNSKTSLLNHETNEDDEEMAPTQEPEPFSPSPEDSSALVEEVSIDGGALEDCPTSEDSPMELMSAIEEDESCVLASEYMISDPSDNEAPFNALFSNSKCISAQRDGSYLLQTKIIDGVIHAANVKTLDTVYVENLNGSSSPIHRRPSPLPAKNSKRKSFRSVRMDNGSPTESEEEDSVGEKKNEVTLELDDDVKRLWFWGFDTRPKKEVAVVTAAAAVVAQPQQRRLTRSSYQKALLSQPAPEVTDDSGSCQCLVANPGLCLLSVPRPEDPAYPEEEMVRAREAVRKRRQCNYRRFEPIFEVALKSLIYERKKMRRSRREEIEEEEEEEEKKAMEEEGTGEETKKNCGDLKVVPGWYGKGYKKVIKKKKANL